MKRGIFLKKLTVQDQISNIRESMIKRYLNGEVDELTRDLSIEENDVNGYHGREILELLQNIDDAYQLSVQSGNNLSPIEAEISFIDGVLKVSNTGTSFTLDGIKSIVLGHISTKDKTLIGNKGSGFRSILNWSNDIRIYSGEFSCGFSRKYADIEYEKVKLNESLIRQNETRILRGNGPLYFPIFSMPHSINKKKIENYTTTIEIVVDEHKNKDDYNVIKQLNEFDSKILLFLPNLSNLTIIIEDIKTTYSKKITKLGDTEKVSLYSNGNNVEEFYMQKTLLDEQDSEKYIIVASPLSVLEEYPIYSYFPTKQNFPMPLLVHAPFMLSQDRNRIITDQDEYNKSMFVKILDEAIALALKLRNLQNDKELPLNSITLLDINEKNWTINEIFKDFNLIDYYLNSVTNAEIIPLRNGGFTKITKELRSFNIPTPDCFKGDGFELLIENIKDDKSNLFVKKLLKRKGVNLYFSSAELTKILNQKVLSIEERVETYIWWSEVYAGESYRTLPNLIEIDGEYITNSEHRIFLPSQDGISDLPNELKKHVKLKIISQDFIDLLIIKLKKTSRWNDVRKQYTNPSDKRILDRYSEEFLKLRFSEQSSREMIIREVNNQIRTFDMAIEYTKWLFDLYKKGELISQSIKEITFNLPVENGINKSNNIYLGKNWENQIAEYLFDKNRYQELVDYDFLQLDILEKPKFIIFIMELGVSKYPVFTNKQITSENFKISLNKPHLRQFYSFTCDNFEELIDSLDTLIVCEWFNNDPYLSNILSSAEEKSFGRVRNKSFPEYFKSNEYILYILNNTKWIMINGIKYSPKDIIMFEKMSNIVDGFYGISKTSLTKVVGEMLISHLEFRKMFSDFTDDQINSLMLKLSVMSDNIISPRLYDDIARGKRDQKPLDQNYDTSKFRILCKDGKFYKSSEVWYANKIVPRIYTNNPKNHFINISPKLGTNTIFDWFGVKKFEIDLKYKNHIPLRNDAIDNDINDLKVSLLSSIDNNNNNINNMKRLKIVPVSSLVLVDEYNNEIKIEDDYYHVSNNNVVYLKIANNYDPLKVTPILTDIFRNAIIYNFDEKLVQLLILFNRKQKKEYINSEYGIDKWVNVENSLFKNNSSNKIIFDFFKIKKLDEQLLKSLSIIDFDSNIKYDQYDTLVNALSSINCDISDLNNLDIFPKINITKYWNKKLEEYIIKNTHIYNSYLFTKYQSESIEKKKSFFQKINDFSNFDHNFINSIYVNINDIILKEFGFSKYVTNTVLDIDSIYIENYKKIDINNIEFNDFISDDWSLKSLVYFIDEDTIDYIQNEFSKNHPPSLEDTVNILVDNNIGKIVNNPVFSKDPVLLNNKNKPNTRKSKTTIKTQKKKQDINGIAAEEKAYITLLEKYPNLKWTSENAHSNLPERNTSTSFDMYYVNSENEKVLVEVKHSTKSFYMSSSEYELAKIKGNLYEIWLVDIKRNIVNGPKFISEFESSKVATEYMFSYTTKK